MFKRQTHGLLCIENFVISLLWIVNMSDVPNYWDVTNSNDYDFICFHFFYLLPTTEMKNSYGTQIFFGSCIISYGWLFLLFTSNTFMSKIIIMTSSNLNQVYKHATISSVFLIFKTLNELVYSRYDILIRRS